MPSAVYMKMGETKEVPADTQLLVVLQKNTLNSKIQFMKP